ncbi:heat-shock protein Hsp20 [Taibaiella sp. KBW10]|uniref:Hsp20/alpha crystallin family protein n=1 Tax=Taibaiella sp. KBW10 TaxID=2153357 RepID=UPI000F5A3428|nr:Hsp20/alpha crystallin family protein [Taibaiella sp. KBW10]RQO30340.1 heat-shock protein Hsp20 [Taibaiella sp. KBW10]
MFNRQSSADWNNNDFFGSKFKNCKGDFAKKLSERFGAHAPWMSGMGHRKAANIQENETEFIISLYAAGLQKEGFKIEVTGEDVLTIRYQAAETQNGQQYIHQEYQPGSFERAFQLNGKVLTNQVQASYQDGVLWVTLPKNPDTNKPAQEVSIS